MMSILVPFALDPSALSTLDIDQFRRLMGAWKHYGFIIDQGVHVEGSVLNDAVRKLGPEQKLLWRTHLSKGMVRALKKADCREIDWKRVGQLTDLHSLKDIARVVALEETWSVEFDDLPRTDSDVEYVTAKAFDQSERIEQAKGLNGQRISRSTDLDYIWETYFRPFARTSTQVDVVDRYCLDNFVNEPDTGGLRFFLESMARDAREATIQIYAGTGDAAWSTNLPNLDKLVTRFWQTYRESWFVNLAGTGIRSLKIHLIRNYPGQVYQYMHERWFRFNHSKLNTDRGLGLFASERPGYSNVPRLSRYPGVVSCSHPRPDNLRNQSADLKESHLYHTIDVL